MPSGYSAGLLWTRHFNNRVETFLRAPRVLCCKNVSILLFGALPNPGHNAFYHDCGNLVEPPRLADNPNVACHHARHWAQRIYQHWIGCGWGEGVRGCQRVRGAVVRVIRGGAWMCVLVGRGSGEEAVMRQARDTHNIACQQHARLFVTPLPFAHLVNTD